MTIDDFFLIDYLLLVVPMIDTIILQYHRKNIKIDKS